jgi:hypothetical protein
MLVTGDDRRVLRGGERDQVVVSRIGGTDRRRLPDVGLDIGEHPQPCDVIVDQAGLDPRADFRRAKRPLHLAEQELRCD